MATSRITAVVLTAGFGSRLRPLTLFLPKALLPVGGETVAGHTLRQLARVGCESVVLNLHHLADTIPAHFGSIRHGLPITYSRESPIQGTLGALYPFRDHLAEADLILLTNGDTMCKWPWKAMIKRHVHAGADATLLLHRKAPEKELGGPIAVDAEGDVVQLRDSDPTGEIARRHLFAGAHVLSPKLLSRIEEGPSDIITDLYIPLLREGGRIHTVVTGRRWHDLGTPKRYLQATLDWTRTGTRLPRLKSRGAISPLAEVDDTATLHRSTLEAGVLVGGGAKIESSVLLSDARVPSHSTIRHCILGPGVELPASTHLDHRMVTRVQSGAPPGERDSVMGDLVYTPLDDD